MQKTSEYSFSCQYKPIGEGWKIHSVEGELPLTLQRDAKEVCGRKRDKIVKAKWTVT